MVAGGLAEEVCAHGCMTIAGPRADAGQTVLVQAAARGVRTQSVQLARERGAGKVIGTTRSSRPATQRTQLAVDHMLITSGVDFADEVLKGRRRDGCPNMSSNIRAAAVHSNVLQPLACALNGRACC
jgi:NADPH2:quinone reductase